MAALNKIEIIGHVSRIEYKDTQNGTGVALFSVGVNEKYRNKQGEQIEQTEWFSCVAFQKLAEIAAKYVQKGHLIYIEGSIKTEKYTGKDGIERTATKVIARNIQLLERKEQAQQTQQFQPTTINEYENKQVPVPFDDDLPF